MVKNNIKINVGVIGIGRMGRVHTEHLAFRIFQANLVSVADINIDAAKDFAERLGISKVTENYQEILDDKKIEAVAICSSTDTHTQLVIEAAQAGKHIFCEKPIGYELSEVDKALRAVEKAGVKFQVGFNRRFDPNFIAMKQAILEGKVGTPHFIHIVSTDPALAPIDIIRVSGGIFLDMTIHDFDMSRFLIGSEVEKLFTTGAVMIDPKIGEAGDVDTALTILWFKNGVIGTIHNSRQTVYGQDQRVEIFGSAGSIATENQTPHRTVVADDEGFHTPKLLYSFIERYREAYLREMQAFIDAIVNNTETPVSGIDGRIPIVMALAAQKSCREQRLVKLSEVKAC